jgi:hypothetical protein
MLFRLHYQGQIAKAIGQAMAIMHWSANVDCYDVEFVLGSEGETTYTEEICRFPFTA